MEEIQWSSQAVAGGIDVHLQRQHAYAQQCETVIESLGDVAAEVCGGGGEGNLQQLEQLRGAVAQMLSARRTAHMQEAALQDLKGSYAAGPEPTDFKAALSSKAEAAAAAAPPYVPQQDPLFRDFEAMAGGQGGDAGQPGDEQIDDDIAIEGGADQLAPNVRCPISNRLLLEIEDPVQDATGVVYEKAAVFDYFRTLHPSKRGRDKIVAGSNHEVTLAELVPAERVLKEKRLQARRHKAGRGDGGGQGGGAGGSDVLDV